MRLLTRLILAVIVFHGSASRAGGLKAPNGRYTAMYENEVLPLLQLPQGASREDERRTLEAFLKRSDLSELTRYLMRRRLVLVSEFTDHLEFARLSRDFKAKPDDYLLLSSLDQNDESLDYTSLVGRLEKYFEEALEHEPGSEVAAWVAYDALGVMTEHYDFARATVLAQKAVASVPEGSIRLRSRLLDAIGRLYLDPGNSPAQVRQGMAIYAENEKQMRQLGLVDEASNDAYNQGIGALFSFHDDAQALEHFSRVHAENIYQQDAWVFGALAHAHRGDKAAARNLLKKLDFTHYRESPMRVFFLRCYVEITRALIGDTAELNLCAHLPEDTQGDVIQHMTDEILQLPLSPALETAILKQFQNFYKQKISPQIKQRTAQSVDGLELARVRAESDRSRYESKITRIERDLAQKQSQLTAYVALSVLLLVLATGFGLWRRQVQQQRMHNLQQFLQTRILSRFLPPALVEEIRLGRSRLEEDPQKRTVTILFADLVNFTAKAEQLGTERTATLLNHWMQIATEVVFAANGTIDKFIGDCVMVIFGAPLELKAETQVERAVACGRQLMAALDAQNEIWLRDYGVGFQLRVGINQGEAIVGSFGSEKRSDYTVIGGAVNLASRIENMAEPGQILLSQSAAQHLRSEEYQSLGPHAVRGIADEQELFAVHKHPLRAAV